MILCQSILEMHQLEMFYFIRKKFCDAIVLHMSVYINCQRNHTESYGTQNKMDLGPNFFLLQIHKHENMKSSIFALSAFMKMYFCLHCLVSHLSAFDTSVKTLLSQGPSFLVIYSPSSFCFKNVTTHTLMPFIHIFTCGLTFPHQNWKYTFTTCMMQWSSDVRRVTKTHMNESIDWNESIEGPRGPTGTHKASVFELCLHLAFDAIWQ